MNTGPGIIVNTPKSRQEAAHSSSPRVHRRSLRRSTIQVEGAGARHGRQSVASNRDGLDSIDVERLSYINTALEAMPGMTLRRFFAPVMRVRGRLMARERASTLRLAKYTKDGSAGKARRDAVNQLCTALTSAAAEVVFDAPLSVDVNALTALLADKLEPVSYRVEEVLSLPCEPPEAAFVYIVVSGSVRVTHYQQQQLRRNAGGTGPAGSGSHNNNSVTDGAAAALPRALSDRKQFFTSSDEVFPLCTPNGIVLGTDGLAGGDGAAAGAGVAGETGTVVMAGRQNSLTNDAVSVTNTTTAIQRSLRKASRAVGQPTLQPTRTELLRAPCVLGAAQALGLAPGRCASCTATATAMPGGPKAAAAATADGAFGQGEAAGGGGGMQYVEYTDVLRVRALDVHAALVELARQEREARGGDGEWLSAPLGALPPRGVARTVADFIAAARAKTLSLSYPQSEVLMRQSWLLQDTPPATLRSLITRLSPRTYMPGEVIACPHTNTPSTRQLCFLRRGRLLITEASGVAEGGRGTSPQRSGDALRLPGGGSEATKEVKKREALGLYGPGRGCAQCGSAAPPRVLEVVHAGASFGELSVLFGEARSYTLVADSVCDVWCLPHADFAHTMRRDDTLRATLVEKAAALRIKWLAEQRFTPALADHLRRCSEMFRPFCDVVLRLIQERIEPVVYSPGQLITSTSARCEEMIFIMQGRVQSICEGVAAYGPGDVLGEGCLVAHRWPLGLAARTMVEGWRLPRDRLLEALARADTLHAHSGEVTSQAPILMKQIFQPPIPEAESDVVGRLRMPVVGPAPAGLRYADFARRTAEVQLKALCFTHRDYVKWEDINYASMDAGKSSRELAASDTLARDFAIARMRGEVGVTVTTAPRPTSQSRPSSSPQHRPYASIADAVAAQARAQPRRSTGAPKAAALPTSLGAQESRPETASSAAAGSGRAAAARITAGGTATERAASASVRRLRVSTSRKSNTGACAFLVNPAMMSAPFTRHPVKGRGRQPLAQAFTPAPPSLGVSGAHKMPPRLRSLTHTLGERDRVLAGEIREEAELEKKLAAQQRATVKEQMGSATTTLAGAAPGPHTSSAAVGKAGTGGSVQDTVASLEPAFLSGKTPAGGTAAVVPASLLVSDPVPLTAPMPPVHIFLSGERPRTEITMAEALSIGYVMQLPSTHSIQSCVSLVDPDVTVGPPAHRQRRHAMAITPNDRVHKHNFLFAAAVFENISKLEEQLQGLREEERLKKSKAQKLMSMLQASVNSARWHASRRSSAHELYQQDILLTPADGAMPDSSARGCSPVNSASRRRSPSGQAVSPMRQDGAAVAARLSTPSPFRGSPGKGSAKKEEAFERLLKREPARALEMLSTKYHLSAVAAGAGIAGLPPRLALTASQESAGAMSGRGANDSATTAAMPRGTPSLLERMQDAVHPRHRSHDEDHVMGEVGAGEDGVRLTNTAAPALLLPVANDRDRHHAQQSYLSTIERQFAGGAAAAAGSPSMSTSAMLLGSAQSATVETHLTQRKDSVLFVDGYGALGISLEAQAAGSVVLTPAHAMSTRSGPPSEDDETFGAAGGEEVGENSRLRRVRTLSRSVTTTFTNAFASGSNYLAGPLTPQDFVMPDVDDANAIMRRIQRDVEGLNAVAKEQARERRAAREKERQFGAKTVRAAAAALAKPSAEEAQVLDDWQRMSHLLSRDPIAAATVPDALRSLAGPDYLRRGVGEVNEAVAAEAAREAASMGVAAWRDEQLLRSATAAGGGGGGGLVPATPSRTGGMRTQGGLPASETEDPTAARRTIAAIGTSQLGYAARPLASPTRAMDPSAYQRYRQDREAFFEAFKRNPQAVLTGELVEPPLPPGCDAAAIRQSTGMQPADEAEGGVWRPMSSSQPLFAPHPPPARPGVMVAADERQLVPWL